VTDARDPDALAALCARALADPPTADELARALLVDPAVRVFGDPGVGVVAAAAVGEVGYLRLIAVDRSARRRGIGRTLIHEAETYLRGEGVARFQVGGDVPRYLWPGVDVTELGLLALLEAAGYARGEAALNLDVPLDLLPPAPAAPPAEVTIDAVAAWCREHWPNWEIEFVAAAERDGLVAAVDATGISALCARDVLRDGWIGPVASRPDLRGRGAGRAPLLHSLHALRADGRTRAEIAWAGPLRPYLAVGARPGRTFVVLRKPA
jgi:GNAT superfamily N-acetyltransferase